MPPPVLSYLLRTTPTIAPISNREILSVTGSQCSEFLNGLLATSVRGPFRNQFSTILHAQGRVMYDVFLYATNNGYLLEYDARESKATPLPAYLKRHVLRSKVKIRDASENYDVWSSWGSEKDRAWETQRKWVPAQSGAVEPDWTESEDWPWGNQEHVIHDRRAVGMGRRLLVNKGDKPQEAATHDVVPTEEYLLHRILNGVPEGMTDIQPMQSFPMNSNLDVMGGLDFRKGCYVGQELTVRTYHTGVIRKRILPVIIHYENVPISSSSSDVPSGKDIMSESTDLSVSVDFSAAHSRPARIGKILSTHKGVGLALLQTDAVLAQNTGASRFHCKTLDGDKETKWGVAPYWPDWWPRERYTEPDEP